MMEDHESVLAISDRAFLGEGLFETIKIRNSKPLFSHLHWQRLKRSAQSLGISFSLSIEEWHQLLVQKVQQELIINGGMKVVLSGGIAARGLISKGQNNKLLIQCFTYNELQKPLRLIHAPWLRDANNPIYGLKTLNYLESIIARRQALEQGADDALFFNTQQWVTEATTANIFFIHQECVYTPSQKDGLLPGITRARILKHCIRLAIEHKELSINQEFINNAQAAFLTNSLLGIHYVAAINEQEFMVPHPLIEQLKEVLAEEV